MTELEVLIIGGGLSGVSTAYHLKQQGLDDIMIVEAGKIGIGSDETLSGSNGPKLSKIICTIFDTDYEVECDIVGDDMTRKFLDVAYAGVKLQVSLAEKLNPDIVRKNGTILVAHGIQKKWLKREIELYPEEYTIFFRDVSIDELGKLYGAKKSAFDGGICMPHDALIDPSYVNLLAKKTNCEIVEGTKVIKLKHEDDGIVVYTDIAGGIKARYVVNATNGFFPDKNLKGLLKQKWCYILSFEDIGEDTPNAWEFSEDYHYWVRQDNIMHVGGDDIKFEKTYPRASRFYDKAITRLKEWAYNKFPHLKDARIIQEHYGVYSVTSDEMPIVGNFDDTPHLFHIVGCNGRGQSTLSFCSSLMPGIMGYQIMTDEELEYSRVVNPDRTSLRAKPC
jgi:glycine/D-amino acid oxidase-like deaminating enzyme